MKYCVIINTTTVIDGSENSEEIMLKNAENSGYSKEQIEILTDEEYKTRVDSSPKPTPEQTIEDRISDVEMILAEILGGVS